MTEYGRSYSGWVQAVAAPVRDPYDRRATEDGVRIIVGNRGPHELAPSSICSASLTIVEAVELCRDIMGLVAETRKSQEVS